MKNLDVDMRALFKMRLNEIASDFVDWVRATHYRNSVGLL